MEKQKCWYAVYTKPRWEKKITERFEKKNLEFYCPLTKIRRKWTDRYKIIEEPLFKSYVFVHIEESEKTNVRLTDGVVNFVYWNGKPAIIKDSEIEIIRKFLNEYTEVRAEPLTIEEGQKVRVKTGVMMDAEGEVIKVQKKYVVVVLESLGYKLAARFEKNNLETF